MKTTLSSIFNTFFISLLSFVGIAQQQNVFNQHNPPYKLMIGADLLSISQSFWDKNYQGGEVFASYHIKDHWFATAELGTDKKYTAENLMTYATQGMYIKLGTDHNLHHNFFGLRNLIYIGGRYATSWHSQTLINYKTQLADPYFQDAQTLANTNYTNLHAHWIEFVAGLKAEILPRIYLGFSLRVSALLYQKQPNGFENLYIPGFGETNQSNFGASLNYTLSYRIL